MNKNNSYSHPFPDSEKNNDNYDSLIVSISTKLFDVQMLLSQYMISILETGQDLSFDLDLQLAVMLEGVPKILDCRKIFYDKDQEKIKLVVLQYNGIILWDQLDISAMDIVVNFVHSQYKRENLYQQFKNRTEN